MADRFLLHFTDGNINETSLIALAPNLHERDLQLLELGYHASQFIISLPFLYDLLTSILCHHRHIECDINLVRSCWATLFNLIFYALLLILLITNCFTLAVGKSSGRWLDVCAASGDDGIVGGLSRLLVCKVWVDLITVYLLLCGILFACLDLLIK